MSQNSCPHLTQDIYLRQKDRGCTLHKSKACIQLYLGRKPPQKIIQLTESSTHLPMFGSCLGEARYSVSNRPLPTLHVVKTHVAGFSEGWFSTEKDPTGLLGALSSDFLKWTDHHWMPGISWQVQQLPWIKRTLPRKSCPLKSNCCSEKLTSNIADPILYQKKYHVWRHWWHHLSLVAWKTSGVV